MVARRECEEGEPDAHVLSLLADPANPMPRLECPDALWRRQKRRFCRGFGRSFGRRRGALPRASRRSAPLRSRSWRRRRRRGRPAGRTSRGRAPLARVRRSLAEAASWSARRHRNAGQGGAPQADALVRRAARIRPTLVQRRSAATHRRPPGAGRPPRGRAGCEHAVTRRIGERRRRAGGARAPPVPDLSRNARRRRGADVLGMRAHVRRDRSHSSHARRDGSGRRGESARGRGLGCDGSRSGLVRARRRGRCRAAVPHA